MSFISRGFHRRQREPGQEGRVPPGQYVTVRLPGALGRADASIGRSRTGRSRSRARSTSRCAGAGTSSARCRARPSRRTSTASPSGRSSTRTGRASRWTRCSTASRRSAEFVVAFSDGGYTTNLPLEDVTGGKAWVAFGYDGEPLEPEHGGPARLLVPHLYFWKSAKWVRGLQLREHDEPGFWEGYGYHNYGDPWLEQRYAATELAARRGRRRPSRRRRGSAASCSTRPAGPATGRASTSTSGSRPRTATRRSAATRSPPRRRGASSSLTVERLDDGEVSPYLVDELRAGDKVEVRGPIGGYFVWEAAAGRAVAARRGRVGNRPADGDPAPARRRRQRCRRPPARVVAHGGRHHLRGRARAPRCAGRGRDHAHAHPWHAGRLERSRGRIDRAMLAEVGWAPDAARPQLRVRPDRPGRGGRDRARRSRPRAAQIRTERFGPTGG